MDGNRFDTITRRLTSVASRRQLLAGFGVATVGALVGQDAAAAPSPHANCSKACNATAKEDCRACKGENTCLKAANEARELCLRVFGGQRLAELATVVCPTL